MRPHPILEKDEVTPRKKAYRPVAHFYSLDHLSLLPEVLSNVETPTEIMTFLEMFSFLQPFVQ